ncbi:MAG: transposase [Deltaproteobacteria bacterium]|jgi:putative transposase|nr:transposase [Deltaproteobacteria bacterium]
MKYRRLYVPGGIYFFTFVTAKRRHILEKHIDLLRESFRRVMKNHSFSIEAIVILPVHLHAIWKLPTNDSNYSDRLMLIKKYFSSALPGYLVSNSLKDKREKGIWQRRFWEHLIRDDQDLRRHYDYIHFNPVKHDFVKRPRDWEYSSFNKYVEQGLYSNDWGETEPGIIYGMNFE